MKIAEMCLGHGRTSADAAGDLERAIRGSATLMNDARSLFDALDSRSEFSNIMKSIATYSKRV
ncbi:MAG TPA: hypothetical protein VEP69_02115 [Thermodesulfovibrionales bacterium]|nr:hypothetical protein [Thermodesulfovibrionales bacterium]